MKSLLPLALLLVAAPVVAQDVPLQLWDHVVGDEILHNRVLPVGTEVWVVTKEEARAVRLRDGYGEVTALLPEAARDRVGGDGYTEGRYRRTAAVGRAYYVLARLPDGRLFQSYVKTGDAGMQPGFDDVQSGRISMGQVPEALAGRLAPALAVVPAAPPEPSEMVADTPEDAPLQSPDDVALPALGGASLLPDTAEPAPVPMQEVDEDEPAETFAPESASASRGWLWLLGGLVLGGAAAYFGTAYYYERLLRRQRENMLRYVPDLAPPSAPSVHAGEDEDAPPFLPTTVAALAEQASRLETEGDEDDDLPAAGAGGGLPPRA